MNCMIELCREPQFLTVTAHKRATARDQIARGLLPPPVKIGARASAWPLHELQAVNAARVAGRSEDEIKQLVARLVKEREHIDRLAA